MQGRFTSVDPENYQARLIPTDPQAWNAYSYVGNNPLARIDPNGKGELWEKFKNAVLHGCRCTDAEIEKKRQADEDKRRQEIRDYSQTRGLDGYVIISGPDGQPQAVTVDSLDRSQVLQISQTIRYLQYGINVEGVGIISHDDALDLISGLSGLPMAGGTFPQKPATPDNMGTSAFGNQVMKWGTGDAAARARMATLTREQLQRAGVTKELAAQWRDFYREVARATPANPSAAGRADLMQRAVELLSK